MLANYPDEWMEGWILNDSIHGCFNYVLVVVHWTSQKCTKKCRPVVLFKKQLFFIYVSVKSKLQNFPPVIPCSGVWLLCRPGEEGIWSSVFQGVGNLSRSRDFMWHVAVLCTKLVDMLWKLAARYRNYTDLWLEDKNSISVAMTWTVCHVSVSWI